MSRFCQIISILPFLFLLIQIAQFRQVGFQAQSYDKVSAIASNFTTPTNSDQSIVLEVHSKVLIWQLFFFFNYLKTSLFDLSHYFGMFFVISAYIFAFCEQRSKLFLNNKRIYFQKQKRKDTIGVDKKFNKTEKSTVFITFHKWLSNQQLRTYWYPFEGRTNKEVG